MSIIDPQVILITTIIDTIVDLIVFKLFRIREITTMINALVNFVIPFLSLWLLVQSGAPLYQQIQAFGDFIFSYMVNFVNFIVSSVFALIISALISISTGKRLEEPY